MAKLLFFAGSARVESLNKTLAKYAAGQADKAGAEVTFIDLKDYPMPIYDGDLEDAEGLPENARKLKQMMVEHDGFFISSPEYNSSFSALLKNTLDWLTRPEDDNEKPLVAFKGKVAALAAVSPGGLGGLRGLVPLRMWLSNIGVTVIPTQAAVSNGFDAFDGDGNLKDDAFLQATIAEFIQTADALS